MIDWLAFIQVFLAAILASSGVVALYSLGIRFLAMPGPKVVREDGTFEPDGPARDDEDDDVVEIGRPKWATVAANICFIASVLCVVVGIYLIVPALH
ncbi:hypothetical protein JSO19_09875 [Leucobacter sp. UCMA 4100]|uniref:hypothetical protein n=1 Tax=Leucobacter sp. UCMA 4100 TaxID=2810534 RepID=UPI0022EA386C|nr:hypothetical protein [Leucobacter sp. UCMA 4100]MDA3147684.1 hypothetical protein [Leucobacter sp. UCMA 4100]